MCSPTYAVPLRINFVPAFVFLKHSCFQMGARARGSLLPASSHWWSSGEDFWFFTQVTQVQFLGKEQRSLKTTPCYLFKIKLVKKSQEMKDFE